MRIVAGRWKGRRLVAPDGRAVRPTADRVREAWMSIVTPSLADARVLDLFAGSGALGIEAVSRGAVEGVIEFRFVLRIGAEYVQGEFYWHMKSVTRLFSPKTRSRILTFP